MSNAILCPNERSEGGQVITEMNFIFARNDWNMKEAVGELSLKNTKSKDDRGSTLFPDVIIFADESRLQPIMGWEFKMPDVSISDKEFVSNAKDKADRLGTGVFVLWNFQYVSVYMKDSNGIWNDKPVKIFSEFVKELSTREAVQKNSSFWKKQLNDVLEYLNLEQNNKKFGTASIEFSISNYTDIIANKLTPIIADYYKKNSDIKFSKYRDWWTKFNKNEVNQKNSDLLYAKNVIMKWINRFIFSHLLKYSQNRIYDILIEFSESRNIIELSKKYNEIVKFTDFYTILNVEKYEEILPEIVIDSLSEFNLYLSQTNFSNASSEFISQLLEAIIDVSKRELMGLYTTPERLAEFLVGLTVEKAEGDFADVTVGSGTIAKIMLNKIKNIKTVKYAHEHTWLSDKYSFPLQIANLSITTPDSFKQKNIVYQKNVFELNINDNICIVNPETGKEEIMKLPSFQYIISNLPFISSNTRTKEEKNFIEDILKKYPNLNNKMDLYQFILLKIEDLLSNDEGAKIGVITSNSWMKTLKGYKSFYKVLSELYDVEYVIISNNGRWFENVEVASDIVVLRKKNKNEESNYKTKFITLNVNPRLLSKENIDELINEIWFEEKSNNYHCQEYDKLNIEYFINMGLSMEVLFDDILWLKDIKNKLMPAYKIFESKRGVRTGADKLFLNNDRKVDDEYIYPILKNLNKTNSYEIRDLNEYYFYIKDDIENVRDKGNIKTIRYLEEISVTPIGINRKKSKGKNWYKADQIPQYADFVTSINPEQRFFWARLNPKSVVNQRVTAFRVKNDYIDDIELLHALLNTSLSLYMLIGSGFGRGLGVTDLTKEGISQIFILNPNLLSEISKQKIISEWSKIKNKQIDLILNQLNDKDWVNFNKLVFREFRISEKLILKIKDSISKIINRRLSLKKK